MCKLETIPALQKEVTEIALGGWVGGWVCVCVCVCISFKDSLCLLGANSLLKRHHH
jgi:hypothetical protein